MTRRDETRPQRINDLLRPRLISRSAFQACEADLTLQDAEEYFTAMIPDLGKMCCDGSPWVFLCGAAVIEYLSKLAYGGGGRTNFIKFVKEYMPTSYRKFSYACKKKDLPKQMYHVLRCGIVHSFSLIPDEQGKENGGRDRSIALSHDICDGHIKNVSTERAPDACCLNAFEFVADLASTMRKLFQAAKTNTQVKTNITNWLTKFPPITGDSLVQSNSSSSTTNL